MTALPALLETVAAEADDQGAPDGWGDVLAVAVIHAEGIRVVTYARELAAVEPARLESHLADLSEMLVGERKGALS